MYRDHDVQTGTSEEDHKVDDEMGRKAVEHVYFDEEKIHGKTISMRVYNYYDSTDFEKNDLPFNDFILGVINKYSF